MSFRILDCRRDGWPKWAVKMAREPSKVIAILEKEEDAAKLSNLLSNAAERPQRLGQLGVLCLSEVLKPYQLRKLAQVISSYPIFLIDRKPLTWDGTAGVLGGTPSSVSAAM